MQRARQKVDHGPGVRAVAHGSRLALGSGVFRRRRCLTSARRAHAAVHVVLLSLAVLLARPLPAQREPALPPVVGSTITGVVVAWPDSTPVVGALVSVDAIDRSVLTARDGRFRLTGVPAGTHTVRIRQIGFRPQSLVIRVMALAELPSLEGRGHVVALPRIPVTLDAVAVRARPGDACHGAGFASAGRDPRLAPIMEQLRANAERYEQLASRYPVEYTVARTRHFRVETGALFAETGDTVRRRSDVRRPYEAGRVLERRFASGTTAMEREMFVPSFADVAGDDFQRYHCFKYAGVERVDGELLHRIDFVPTPEVTITDVMGALYIDPQTFLLRRSVFRLTTLPPRMRVRAVEVITTYRELYPSVLVPDALTTTQVVTGIRIGKARVTDFLQRDQLVHFRWVRAPEEDADAVRPEGRMAERP